jgi:hypothetical protein
LFLFVDAQAYAYMTAAHMYNLTLKIPVSTKNGNLAPHSPSAQKSIRIDQPRASFGRL